MDWNWFLSSFAQSTAAIVGLFGAFVITKIINNEKEYKTHSAKSQYLLNQSVLLKNESNYPYFERDIKLAIQDWDLAKSKDNIRKMIDSVDYLLNKIENHIRELIQHYESISKNEESSTLISISIILILSLYYGGVYIPLYLIQTPNDNLIWAKTNLLLIISLIFTGMFIYFLRINIKMRYKKEELQELVKFTRLEEYSEKLKKYKEHKDKKSLESITNNVQT